MRSYTFALMLVAACGRWDFGLVGDAALHATIDTAGADSAVDAIPGLVVVYPMDDDPAVTGTLVANVPALDGTCAAPCPTATAGHIGGAVQFDGSNCVVLPLSSLISISPYTIAAWALSQNSAQASIVSKALSSSVDYDVANVAVSPSGSPFFETSNAGGSVDVIQPAAGSVVGAWHHLAVTWDGTTKQLYVDGGLANTAAASTTDSTEVVKIGCDTDFGSEIFFFVGALDDVRFYSRALEPVEIGYLAAQ